MSHHVAWAHAVEALQRGRRARADQPLLENAARYRQEMARCAVLATHAGDPAIRAQLNAIADTYRRLARQLEALSRLS